MKWGGAAALLVTAAVLAGCVQEPDEGGTLPPLASPSVSQSAPATPKPTGTDKDQIIALSKDYFAETNRAVNTGDTRRLRSLSTAGCTSCMKVAEYVEKHWKSGSIKAPGYYKVSQVTGAAVMSPTTGYSNVVYTLGQETRLDAAGQTIKINPADPKPQAVSVYSVKVNGAWKVARVVKES